MNYVSEPRQADEERLNELALDLYKSHGRMLEPAFPWVYVRVLPKEQITAGGIVLPMSDQNKTVHEGIVLATWKPVKSRALPRREGDGTDWRASVANQYEPMDLESELQPGDHVLFPFWCGQPMEGFSDKRYRAIKEETFAFKDEGGIFGRVQYAPSALRVREQLTTILRETEVRDRAVTKITEKFLLVERGGYSVTLSGR